MESNSPKSLRWLLVMVALLGATGVGVGAYAAHGLQTSLAEQGVAPDIVAKRVAQAETGVRYHMFHTLAMLVIVLTGYVERSRAAKISYWLMLLGIGLFCGILYSIAIAGSTLHWLVPFGGLSFMIAWVVLAFAPISAIVRR
jgi:uncharacterized membrane protein YgdD (TMEM256/DUF423 family)